MDPRFAVHMWDIIINEQRYTPRPGEVVLDLGAWVGHFTLYCASRGAFVTAYEPVSDYFSLMKHAVDKEPYSHRVTMLKRAVWSSTGSKQIYFGCGGDSSLIAGSGALLEIETESLESVLAGRAFDCVKCDIEGAEYEVFGHAGSDLLGKIGYLTMELHNDKLSQEQHDVLVDNLRRNFADVVAVPEMHNGFATGRFCKIFCTRRPCGK